MRTMYNSNMPLNYNEIEKALQEMKPRHKLYELVKTEMQARGRWKSIRRGGSFTKDRSPYKFKKDA